MDRVRIRFEAMDGQKLQRSEPVQTFASNTINYIEAHFTLGEDWQNYDNLSAVWWNDHTEKSTAIEADGVAVIPPSILKNCGTVFVNLCAWNEKDNKTVARLTTYPSVALHIKYTNI